MNHLIFLRLFDYIDIFDNRPPCTDMEVSWVIRVSPNHPKKNGFSPINHPFWGTPIWGNPHMYIYIYIYNYIIYHYIFNYIYMYIFICLIYIYMYVDHLFLIPISYSSVDHPQDLGVSPGPHRLGSSELAAPDVFLFFGETPQSLL